MASANILFSQKDLRELDKKYNIYKTIVLKSAMDEIWNDYILFLKTDEGYFSSYYGNVEDLIPFLINYIDKGYITIKPESIPSYLHEAKVSRKFGRSKITFIVVIAEIKSIMTYHYDLDCFHEQREKIKMGLLVEKFLKMKAKKDDE